MKHKISDLVTIALFCGFLFIMAVLYFALPAADFSESEKRYLAEMPALEWDKVASGDWGNDAETYMADHIPGRNFFVGLNAYFDLYTGRQNTKDIRFTEDGRLVEAPVPKNDAAVQKNMNVINSFADSLGREINLMIVPSAGWASDLEYYPDTDIIDSIYDSSGNSVVPVDVNHIFDGNPQLYYRTDHHWTSEGAYRAYAYCMEVLNRSYAEEATFQKEQILGFHGSTYSRSALWLSQPEPLELWHSGSSLTVTNETGEDIHPGVFYRERLEEADKYTIFLDGNHSIVRISNPEKDGKILVVRDSYSNCLGCFLAESYGEVILVDLRYYKQAVSQLVISEEIDDILICYSISNFLTDTNLVWLR